MIKVQFGTGPGPQKNDWINYDSSPTLLIQKIPFIGYKLTKNKPQFDLNISYGDIVKGLPLKNNSVDYLFCSHTLEHLSYHDFNKAIFNSKSILKKGGNFALIVPDLECYINSYIKDKIVGKNKNPSINFMKNTHLGLYETRESTISRIKHAFSNTRHQWMWDEESLKNKLLEFNFKNITVHKKIRKDCIFNEVIIPDRLKKSIFIICTK